MKKREKIMEYVFLLAAVISIVAVALICIFLFANGIPAMKKIGFVEFLTGTKWKPGNNKFGIFPMILGSIYVTGGALIIGVPVGVLTSVFMARFCPEGLYKFLKPVVNLLAAFRPSYTDFSDWLCSYRSSGNILRTATDRVFSVRRFFWES